MVRLSLGSLVKILVLYSCRVRAWKIGDFGLTAEGSSKQVQITRYSRGTPSYRAPELIMDEENRTYNNKVDIWALGCILFEAIFRKKAFSSDFAICKYYLNHGFGQRLGLPFDTADGLLPDHPSKLFISNSIHHMLEIDDSRRPAARFLRNELDAIIDLGETRFLDRYQRDRATTFLEKAHQVEVQSTLSKEAIKAQAIVNLGVHIGAVIGKGNPTTPDQKDCPIQPLQEGEPTITFLPPELLEEIPWRPFVYSLEYMYMPRQVHKSISWLISDSGVRNRLYQEFVNAYLHETADRLSHSSPCYIDLWRSYIPSMAFGTNGSTALLNALVALAALQIAPRQADPEKGKERALGFYITALQNYRQTVGLIPAGGDITDASLATTLIFAQFEVQDLHQYD